MLPETLPVVEIPNSMGSQQGPDDVLAVSKMAADCHAQVQSPTQVSHDFDHEGKDSRKRPRCDSYSDAEQVAEPDDQFYDCYTNETIDSRAVLKRRTLRLDYWTRSEECKERKWDHLDYIDTHFPSREGHILQTTLKFSDTAMEPNMFPYETPDDILHFTLWSTKDMRMDDIEDYVCDWIETEAPFRVTEWNYDDNGGERSIDLFHVHVFLRVSSSKVEAMEAWNKYYDELEARYAEATRNKYQEAEQITSQEAHGIASSHSESPAVDYVPSAANSSLPAVDDTEDYPAEKGAKRQRRE